MIEAGVDEAGRGPLAGPVYAAAVILDEKIDIEGLNDSKKISESKREKLAEEIKMNAISWSIGISLPKEIDEINILEATLLAMKRAIEGLKTKPDLVWIDGTHAPQIELEIKTLIKGDQLKKNIMAASILAKVHRDNYMKDIDKIYPGYGFKQHKGYPTKMHIEALELQGITQEHRLSFRPVKIINESN